MLDRCNIAENTEYLVHGHSDSKNNGTNVMSSSILLNIDSMIYYNLQMH